MFLRIYEKYMKLFLSIFYLTDMKSLTYDICDHSVFIWTFVPTECDIFSPFTWCRFSLIMSWQWKENQKHVSHSTIKLCLFYCFVKHNFWRLSFLPLCPMLNMKVFFSNKDYVNSNWVLFKHETTSLHAFIILFEVIKTALQLYNEKESSRTLQ